ncbi:ribbon-helix-helix protein, CopG family [Haloterrigena salinisoli]|uniref:ribbon-helix-helix protein, CopG family n=1 Tax=Haloterrigena salinisoli TaxID=3132747 RepID=UPI0030CFB14D
MEQITVKVPSDTNESLEEYAEAEHDGNRSEAIRELLSRGLEYEEIKTERDRLERKLTETNARQDDVSEIVEYVEKQREVERYRDQRQRMVDQAGLLTRMKWKLTGVPVDDEQEA